MIFGGIQPPFAPALLAAIREKVAPSVADDPLEDLDEVMAEIERGVTTCWLVTEGDEIVGITITQIVQYAHNRQCVIRHCAGSNVRSWIHNLRLIEQWAKAYEGCDSIELIGRPGWQRLLPGWENKAVLLRKAL